MDTNQQIEGINIVLQFNGSALAIPHIHRLRSPLISSVVTDRVRIVHIAVVVVPGINHSRSALGDCHVVTRSVVATESLRPLEPG